MTDAAESDLLGRSIYEAFPDNPADQSDAAERLRVSLNHVYRTGERDELEFRHPIPVRNRPGTFTNHWWGVINTALRSNGKIVGVLHHSSDITDRVIARRDADIRDRLVDHLSNLAFWEFVPETGEAIVSRALSIIFDLGDLEGPVDPMHFWERYVLEDAARQKTQFEALLHDAPGTIIEGEYRIDPPGVASRWVRMRGELVRENPQDPARFVGLAADITTTKRREAELTSALTDRDELLEQKEVLLSEVNHRIKNSLQIVASLLRIDARSAGERKRASGSRAHRGASRPSHSSTS